MDGNWNGIHCSNAQPFLFRYSPIFYGVGINLNFSATSDAHYQLNEIFSFFIYQRTLIGVLISLRLTDYFNSQVMRIGRFYSVRMNTLMVFKIIFRDYPVRTQCYINCIGIFYSSIMFWISERLEPNKIHNLLDHMADYSTKKDRFSTIQQPPTIGTVRLSMEL